MNVLFIRKHTRFAVRRMVELCTEVTGARDGLLVEVSLEGCRIGNLDSKGLATGDAIELGIEGFGRVEAEVRWAQPGIAGLRFVHAFHIPELNQLIQLCRSDDGEDLRAYGT